jgi:hypothetical protein
LWNIGSLLIDGIAKLICGVEYGISAVYEHYLSPVYKIVFPFKDLLIALSFAYLYYYQGMKKVAKKFGDNEG